MLNVVKISLPENCRIICISDIHTYWRETERLLAYCNYKAGEDFLFILGDILERGDDNINALRYVMRLAEKKRVIVIGGNNDMFVHGFAVRYNDEKFRESFAKKPKHCFVEMGETIGITDFSEKLSEKRRTVYEAYKTEIDFIMNLPDAIETDEYIFVHAGIEGHDWYNMEAKKARGKKRFINRGHESDKTVVCGHFPCYAAGRQNSNLPIFDYDRRIIDIDGGAGVNLAAQINALIIEKHGGEYNYCTEFLPIGKPSSVIADYNGSEGWIFVDRRMHLFTQMSPSLENEHLGFIEVRNNETGEQGLVPECMSGYWDGELHVWANLNAFPSVRKGEQIWVYAEYGEYCWCITAAGEVGSVPKKVIRSMVDELYKNKKRKYNFTGNNA